MSSLVDGMISAYSALYSGNPGQYSYSTILTSVYYLAIYVMYKLINIPRLSL